jgi:hypothetical protein
VTTKAAKPKKAKPARTSKPIAWQQLERWFRVGGDPAEWKKAHLDARFLTIPPAVEGVLEALAGWSLEAADQQQAVNLATRALGTYDGQFPLSRRDVCRMLVVCDWALRSALPFWLDQLPTWCVDRSTGPRVRSHHPVLWACQIIDALMVLSPIWCTLEHAGDDRGTASERTIIRIVHRKTTEVLNALALALPARQDLGSGDDHAWICYMAMRAMRDANDRPEPVLRAGVPALIGVLCDIRDGDSQQSIADRCVWSSTAHVEKGAALKGAAA